MGFMEVLQGEHVVIRASSCLIRESGIQKQSLLGR